jgi:hypothetical protein
MPFLEWFASLIVRFARAVRRVVQVKQTGPTQERRPVEYVDAFLFGEEEDTPEK